jgi:predicted DNA-binding protein
MAKKKIIKNDDKSINFRLSKDLKRTIEDKAESKNITTSAYIRDLLERIHNGDYCYKEHVKEKINSFLFSREFMQLMIWIYSKKENKNMIEEDNELDNYIKTLKKVGGHIPRHLDREFDKVLYDVIKVRGEKHHNYFSFHSYSSGNTTTFNLEEVEKFLLSDESINFFINVKGQKNLEAPDVSFLKFQKTNN